MTSDPGNRNSDPLNKGITRISVEGYKCLSERTSVEIRPLTILAGANSSGKSSLLQLLLLLKQTLEASYDPGALLLRGANVRFTSIDQLLSKTGAGRRAKRFLVDIELNGIESLSLTYEKAKKKDLEVVEMSHTKGKEFTRIYSGMTHEEIEQAIAHHIPYLQILAKQVMPKGEWTVARSRCFLGFDLRSGSSKVDFQGGPTELSTPFAEGIRRTIHVPGLRGNPERTYQTTAVGNTFPGTFENYVASVVAHWRAKEDPRVGELGRALEALGLTWKVETHSINDTQVELRVGRLPHAGRGGAKDLVSIADVGFGVSQTLPVLVALLAAEPGQLVYLEQPEIHLHPRAQTALAELLANAAKRGVRVVAETHSEALLLGIQTLVAEGSLDPSLVKLNWFTRRPDGTTEVIPADLDETGAFGDWPEDFGSVALNAENRYLTAVEDRHTIA